jgi:arginyl-tRNA--protein-N-Asp/Glu arginylyltransferase
MDKKYPLETPLMWHTFYDGETPCSYLDEQVARLPLLYPSRKLSPHELDEQLAIGKRRSGYFFYNTRCPNCTACEATRLDVQRFELNATRRRIERRGQEALTEEFADPSVDQQRLDLFNRHRSIRGLSKDDSLYNSDDFEGFLVNTTCPTTEISFRYQGQLVAVSIVDCGSDSLSAVYTYFDPEFSHLNLGTYAIIRQLRWAQKTHRRWLYLGLYVAENKHLNYKGTYLPQLRRQQETWVEIDKV